MSGEFGDHGSGFFHEKLSNAFDDANSGRSNGARIMAAILEPLAAIARTVSYEEACDSSESDVVQEVFDKLPAIRQAMYAMEQFVEPARSFAVKAVADLLRKSAAVKTIDEKECEYSIVIRRELIPDDMESTIIQDAICSLAGNGLHWTGSHWRSGDDYVTYFACKWSSKRRADFLAAENLRLKKELALAKLDMTPSEAEIQAALKFGKQLGD